MEPDDRMALFGAFFKDEDDWLALLRRVRPDEDLLRRAVRVLCAERGVDPDRVLMRFYQEQAER